MNFGSLYNDHKCLRLLLEYINYCSFFIARIYACATNFISFNNLFILPSKIYTFLNSSLMRFPEAVKNRSIPSYFLLSKKYYSVRIWRSIQLCV